MGKIVIPEGFMQCVTDREFFVYHLLQSYQSVVGAWLDHCVKYYNFAYFPGVSLSYFPHQEIRWNYGILRSG